MNHLYFIRIVIFLSNFLFISISISNVNKKTTCSSTSRFRIMFPDFQLPIFVPKSTILWTGVETQVTKGYKEGKSVGACLGEHDGLNLTLNNRTFCGILCTVSAHAAERTSDTDLCAPVSVLPSVCRRECT